MFPESFLSMPVTVGARCRYDRQAWGWSPGCAPIGRHKSLFFFMLKCLTGSITVQNGDKKERGETNARGNNMEKDVYFLEQSLRTRNTGVLASLVAIPVVLVFMYIDHMLPLLSGIFGWRVVAIVPSLLFLAFALFFFEAHRRLTIPLHVAQLAGVMVMMCGICADLATRPEFPLFGRSALVSSLLVCIFTVFVLAGGARKYLLMILVLPLAAMSVYLLMVGKSLSQIEKVWLISNPAAIAIVLGVLALYQEESGRREFHSRAELKLAEESLRRSEKKFRELFDYAEIGMFRSRLDGSELLDVNRRFLEIFGGSREAMIGRSSA